MAYEIKLDTYDASRAWYSCRARDVLSPFAFHAGATLRERVAGSALEEALGAGMSDASLELRAVWTSGAPESDSRSRSYVFLDEGRAAVTVQPSYRGVSVRVGAQSQVEADRLVTTLDTWIPRRKKPPAGIVDFRFWRLTRSCGAKYTDRSLRCPSVESLGANYAPELTAELERLASLEEPDSAGKVILWHGPPGTGKTYAVRALARAWKEELSASVEVVLDPDELFARADYLHEVLLSDDLDEWDDEDDEDSASDLRSALRRPLRLVIIEDSASLFGDRCRSTPGFARLLNLSDGIIGQGLRVVFLLSTNEQLTSIDPAITRSGRCLAVNAFEPLSVEAARAWIAARGGDPGSVTSPSTLSELFEICASSASAAAPSS